MISVSPSTQMNEKERDVRLALRARHVRASRQARFQRRLLLHHLRLPRHAPASLRQEGQQGVETGAGHLWSAKETPVCVHTIQVPRAV